MKKCPYCAEDIQDAAIVCKHCGRDINKQNPTKLNKVEKKKTKPLYLLLIIGVLGLCVCGIISRMFSTKTANAPMATEQLQLSVVSKLLG